MKDKTINDPNMGFPQIVDSLGIRKGEVLMVSSDINRLFYSEYARTGEIPNIDTLIDSLKVAVGEEGTLMFPTFTWDFCKGKPFDIKKSPCKTGTLSNAVLKRTDFRRTRHPLYSFAVWGKDTELLCSMDNVSSFGEGTPFEYFYNVHARNLLIDINLTQGYTFTHHCEQAGKAPYRFFKKFKSEYINENGESSIRTYTMYVRKLALNPLEDFTEMENEFLKNGIEQRIIINDIPYSFVDMHASFGPIVDDVVNNRSRKIYKYKGQNARK